MEQAIKCVTIGDGMVGKTSMLCTYIKGVFPRDYVPTIFEHCSTIITVDDRKIRFELWDTAGQEDYHRLRPLCYPYTDVFLICFSIVSPVSFHNVEFVWSKEAHHFCPKATQILVGTHLDLRNDKPTLLKLKKQNNEPITEIQGRKMAQKIKAYKYLECSALSGQGLKNVFDEAVLCRTRFLFKRKHRCVLL